MQRTQNGRYQRFRVSGHGPDGDSYAAFIPNPLPPLPPLELAPFHAVLESVHLAIGYWDAVMTAADPALLSAFARREALASSQIEGTQSTLTDVLLFELGTPKALAAMRVPADDAAEVGNCVAALAHGIARMRDGFPLSGRLLREVHGRLLQGEARRHLTPGEFRRSQNWIGGPAPAQASYVPPPAAALADCLAQLEYFLHDEQDGLPTVVRAALAHAQFESIHPFLDGNGRSGRILIALLFELSQIVSHPVLYPSGYLKQHRADYYALLDQLRERGDWEAWLRYCLDAVLWAAEDGIETAERLGDLLAADRQALAGAGEAAALDAFAAQPILDLPQLAQRAELSASTAAAAVDALLAPGILQPLPQEPSLFTYAAFLSIISEGLEPLP